MAKSTKSAASGSAPASANGKKTVCPVGRAAFRKDAKPVVVNIGGVPLVAGVKEFATGSLGWYAQGKIPVEVGGVIVEVQVGLNMTCVGSKDLPA